MATRRPDQPLAGWRVLVCRPEPEGGELARHLQAAGAATCCLPAMERQPLPETPEQRTILQDLDLFRHVIVVSPYAARLFLERLDAWWPQTPVGIHWYGVGAGSGRELAQAGLNPAVPGGEPTSEALLGLEKLKAIDGDRVLLVKGEGGRHRLRLTLQQRGARITELTLYQRSRPDYPGDRLDEALVAFMPEAVIALSAETLNNLIALSKNTNHTLTKCWLVVPAERVAEHARTLGFSRILIAPDLSPAGMVQTLAGIDP